MTKNILLIIFVICISSTNVWSQPFTKIVVGDIVSDGKGSRSANWVDVNNDGFLDMFVSNGKNGGENNMLYLNNNDGTFTQIFSDPLVSDGRSSDGASLADYNNDGLIDAFVANWYNQSNLLYKNLGDTSWLHVTTESPSTNSGYSEASSWADYDLDGDLDLFVANSGGNYKNFLYQNNGEESFTKITTGVVVTDAAISRCGVWGDYDNDGDPDLFVANEGGSKNQLYENLGGGNFAAVTTGEIVNDFENSWSGSWGDYDNDGDLDLFVANNGFQYNSLYQNNGDATFTKVTGTPEVLDKTYSTSSGWVDYDNDGDLDLFVANGFGGGKKANLFYVNDGSGGFTKRTDIEFVTDSGWAYGCAWGDYDRDGDQDLFVSRWQSETENNDLYRNDTGTVNNWINIHCVGVISNNSAIGTRVKLKATIDGTPTWQTREISSMTAYCSQNSLNVAFGFIWISENIYYNCDC